MSHHIYHTTGLIVGLKPKGETDLLLKVFTRDFGMVLATAQGARKMVSKNRFGLRLYAVPEFDLIKTKESFRVGAVRPEPYAPDGAETLVRAKVSAILARFVVSDEPHEKLFDDVLKLFKKQNKNLDILAMIVILESLGYWHSTHSDLDFIESGDLGVDQKTEIINRINESVSHIHL
jgi:recombinational DNA repair protein (RecF pathway)